MGQQQRDRTLHIVEGGVWALVVLVALLALGSTLGATFPARGRALLGEAVVATVALVLMWVALRRAQRRAPVTAVQVVLALARVLVGVPLLLFALVVSAAGFAA